MISAPSSGDLHCTMPTCIVPDVHHPSQTLRIMSARQINDLQAAFTKSKMKKKKERQPNRSIKTKSAS